MRPDGFTLRTILPRLAERGDLFRAVLDHPQPLPPLAWPPRPLPERPAHLGGEPDGSYPAGRKHPAWHAFRTGRRREGPGMRLRSGPPLPAGCPLSPPGTAGPPRRLRAATAVAPSATPTCPN